MLKEVTNYLKAITKDYVFFRGLQDKSKMFSVTLYPIHPQVLRKTIGKKGYSEHYYTLAFLGNKNFDQSYERALELYQCLNKTNFKLGEVTIVQMICLLENPVYLGFNESQLCEFMIDFKIVRKEN